MPRRSAANAAERYSRPPLQRMLQIHQRLKAGKFPNCRKLSEELEVSSKTIQRDIEFMRDRLDLPIEYEPLQFGYYYSEPVTSFPSIEVTEGEVVALFVAQKALAQYKGTSFERPLKAAFEKISDGLQDTIAFAWHDVDSAISFRGLGGSIADIDLFETLSKAVLNSHELSFEYKKLNSNRHEGRRVRPYHLACIENQWYLFGYDLTRQQLRTFALPRIRQARDTGVTFQRPTDFSIAKLLRQSFGVFSTGGTHHVSVRFDAFAAQLVGERRWHPSQKVKHLPSGEAELAMDLGSLEEIERWILSWGSHARVLGPPELVRSVSDSLRAALSFYDAEPK